MTTRERPAARQRVAIGTNPERNRSHNRRVVLDVVRMHGALGRTEIARLTRLTPQAVANIVEELCSEDMLVEVGRRRAGRGQPPIQFAVNPEGPMTAGVEIAGDRIATVLLDLGGGVRARRTAPLADTRPEIVVEHLSREIAALRRQGGSARLLGVGVVMPGPFEVDGMSSVGPATLPGWSGIDPRGLIEEATGTMAVIENDANAAAVGERLFGAGRPFSSFCLLYFGVGIGLGIIHEGRPLRGAHGNAGEIGHTPTRPRNDRPAGGWLEQHASLYALRDRLAAAGLIDVGPVALDALLAARHPVLMDWIAEAADHLAPVVGMLENLLDPETIILGGALPDALTDALIAALEPLPISVAARPHRTVPRVLRGQTGRWTAALGAAALPLMETLTPRLDLAIGPLAPADTEPN
ncbi:Sugar kinase of the NBD/HSP70 family, may contain an N-terminal HTH domain [Devosia enhydra]|uniref:Sugar kinase of the NBD/HSP70 family, may contain an N-terminal HTH domain n=1 Tax=Devosia enhydra TaxID=665118 RepID=A0A1K2HY44_9HYPH|nr:ROK family protein [Devosia enhydra]SFZ84784.1 Sugar kinase of the NBD/HSP70 family, may contain an N-terminal HTH domain [Devosia enhydra]